MNRTKSVSIEQVFKHVSNENNNVNFYQKIVGSVFLDSFVSDHKQNVSCNGLEREFAYPLLLIKI
jgi:hypothetical protein